MSDFDRIRPPGSAPRSDQADGRRALFSPPPVAGLLKAHCSRCGQATSVSPGQAVRSALPLMLFCPWREHPVFAVCPACRRRSWLRVDRVR